MQNMTDAVFSSQHPELGMTGVLHIVLSFYRVSCMILAYQLIANRTHMQTLPYISSCVLGMSLQYFFEEMNLSRQT